MKELIYEFLKDWEGYFTASEIHSEFSNISLNYTKSICRQLANEGRVKRWWFRDRWLYRYLS